MARCCAIVHCCIATPPLVKGWCTGPLVTEEHTGSCGTRFPKTWSVTFWRQVHINSVVLTAVVPPPPPNGRPNSANFADLFCRFVGFLNFADFFC